MGKRKEGARVKGNLQPATSGRAAELLSSGSFAFGSQALGAGFSTVIDEWANVDGEVKVLFKRMQKRDPVTRSKALEEFSTFILAQDPQSLESVVQIWRVRKQLAPVLKDLIGSWLCSQYDTSKEVATLAKNAFQIAFPKKKTEALLFCQSEILEYVSDNILNQTPETLSDPRFTTPEEMRSKYERVVSSSFYIIGHLLENISPDELAKCSEAYKAMFSDERLWSMCTSEFSRIRRSAYSLIKSLCLKAPDFIEPQVSLLSRKYLAKVFDEKDVSTHVDLWESLLLFTKSFPKSWTLAPQKLLSKMLRFLKSGSHGSVAISYPSLLPLIANVPQEFSLKTFLEACGKDCKQGSSITPIPPFFCRRIVSVHYISALNEKEERSALVEQGLLKPLQVSMFPSKFPEAAKYLRDEDLKRISMRHVVKLFAAGQPPELGPFFVSRLRAVVEDAQRMCKFSDGTSLTAEEFFAFCKQASDGLKVMREEILSCNIPGTDSLAIQISDLALASIREGLDQIVTMGETRLLGASKLVSSLSTAFAEEIASHKETMDAVEAFVTRHFSSTLTTIGEIDAAKNLFRFLVGYINRSQGANDVSEICGKTVNAIRRKPMVFFHAFLEMLLEGARSQGATECAEIDEYVNDIVLSRLINAVKISDAVLLEQTIASALICGHEFGFVSKTSLSNVYRHFRTILNNLANYRFVMSHDGLTNETEIQVGKSVLTIVEKVLQHTQRSKSSSMAVPVWLFEQDEEMSSMTSDLFDIGYLKLLESADSEEVELEPSETSTPESLHSLFELSERCWSGVKSVLTSMDDLECKRMTLKTLLSRWKANLLDLNHRGSPKDLALQLRDVWGLSPGDLKQDVIDAVIQDPSFWQQFHSDSSLDVLLGIFDPLAKFCVDQQLPSTAKSEQDCSSTLGLYARVALVCLEFAKDAGAEFVSYIMPHTLEPSVVKSTSAWFLIELLLFRKVSQDLTWLATANLPGHILDYNSHEDAWEELESLVYRECLGLEVSAHRSHERHDLIVSFLVAELDKSSFHGGETEYEPADLILISTMVYMLEHATSGNLRYTRILYDLLEKLFAYVQSEHDAALGTIWSRLLHHGAVQDQPALFCAILLAFQKCINTDPTFKEVALGAVSRVEDLGASTTKETNKLLKDLSTVRTALELEDAEVAEQVRCLVTERWPQILDESVLESMPIPIYADICDVLSEFISIHGASMSEVGMISAICETGWERSHCQSNSWSKVLLYRILQLFYALLDVEIGGDALEAIKLDLIQKCLEAFLADHSSIPESSPLFQTQVLISEISVKTPEDILLELHPVDELCRLLMSTNVAVQKTAYLLLRRITMVDIATKALEAELRNKDIDVLDEQSFPEALMENLGDSSEMISETSLGLGFMLTWMAIFDHFEQATLELKVAFINQMRGMDSAVASFLEFVFALLRVGKPGPTFDVSVWDFSSYDFEVFHELSQLALSTLAAHLYLRALRHIPSLVRIWWTECRNRQLSIAVESFTEKWYSPLIISREIESVLDADKSKFEDMVVKVSQKTNEVSATYSVEDSGLEMIIKLPNTYPLRHVEVDSGSGGQRAGVTEARWRAWLLAASAVIVSQNGSIQDALLLFKRNISLHFEGVEDCAICYSIIGVIDGTLPKKQCKTCKHLFHASCLYKTSEGSIRQAEVQSRRFWQNPNYDRAVYIRSRGDPLLFGFTLTVAATVIGMTVYQAVEHVKKFGKK
ncbi:listerin E3 ubiquitin protein ligase 1 [Quaeritorhiza haematococci]|nr:listerin E3 ubiquitin protein ligase 1 [Quaeritorhiza haematococci]